MERRVPPGPIDEGTPGRLYYGGAVLLGGVDVFHLMNDREMCARGLAGNHCLYVAELDGHLEVPALERRLAAAVHAVPELRWQLSTSVPGRPRWVLSPSAAPAVTTHEGVDPRQAIERLLDQRVGERRPWGLDVVRGADRDLVVLRWFHPLADAKAAERLLAWLGSGDERPLPPPRPDDRVGSSDRLLARLGRDEKIALARAYVAHVMELGRVPTCSPADARPPGNGAGAHRSVRVMLDEEQTRAFDVDVRQRARLAETSLMLIATTRAIDGLLRDRGFAPPQYLVPMPLSFDPKTERDRLFGNVLTMMLIRLDRDDLADTGRALTRIAEQQREIVRKKLDLGMLAGLELARWLPRPAYRWLLGRPFRGPASSLVISNPGAISLERFAGRRVVDAYPLPTMISPPGVQAIFSRHHGRLSIQLVYLDGAVSDEEASRASDRLRAELTRSGT
jgi:hypothetical protein